MISANEALDRFDSSTGTFLALAKGFREEHWAIRPPGEEWSASQTLEHVHDTNERTLRRLRQGLPGEGRTPTTTAFADENIVETMFHGVAPPSNIADPIGRFATPVEGMEAMIEACRGIAECARSAGDSLRGFTFAHPVFGPFDGVQWLLFLAAHTENHIPQLRRLLDHCEPGR